MTATKEVLQTAHRAALECNKALAGYAEDCREAWRCIFALRQVDSDLVREDLGLARLPVLTLDKRRKTLQTCVEALRSALAGISSDFCAGVELTETWPLDISAENWHEALLERAKRALGVEWDARFFRDRMRGTWDLVVQEHGPETQSQFERFIYQDVCDLHDPDAMRRKLHEEYVNAYSRALQRPGWPPDDRWHWDKDLAHAAFRGKKIRLQRQAFLVLRFLVCRDGDVPEPPYVRTRLSVVRHLAAQGYGNPVGSIDNVIRRINAALESVGLGERQQHAVYKGIHVRGRQGEIRLFVPDT